MIFIIIVFNLFIENVTNNKLRELIENVLRYIMIMKFMAYVAKKKYGSIIY